MNKKIKSCLFLSFAFLLETITCKDTVNVLALDVNSPTEMDEEAQNIYDEIEFIDELTYDNRNVVRKQIEQINNKCNAYLISSDCKQTDLSIYVKNYYKLVDLMEKIDFYDKADESGLLAEIKFDNEIEKDDILEITVDVRNVGLSPFDNITYDTNYRKVILEEKENASGSFSLAVNEKKSFTIKLKALEGGYDNISISFKKDDLLLTNPIDQLFINSPGYFFTDCHTHSNRSDGAISMNDNLRYALNNGMNTLYATDHNAYVESTTDILDARMANKESSKTNFLYLKGSEFTDYNGGAGHAVYYNPVKHYPTPASPKGYQELIHNVINDGAFFYMAHPFDPGTTAFKPLVRARQEETIDEFISYFNEQTGIEVMSFWQYYDPSFYIANYVESTIPNRLLWDYLNIKGYKKYFGLANSDAHWATALGMNRNGIYLENFTESNLNNSLGNGSFYMSNGPELKFNIDNKTYGQSLIVSGKENKNVSIKAYGTTSALTNVTLIKYTLNENYKQGYQEGIRTTLFDDPTGSENKYYFEWNDSIEVSPNELYRVEVFAKTTENLVRQAYANPIWITTPATSFTLDKNELSLDAGTSTKVNFEVDNVFDSVSVKTNNDDLELLDNGFIKASPDASGKYTITYTTTSGLTQKCEVNVINKNKTPTKQKGCKSSLAPSLISIEGLLAALYCLKQRKEKKNEN